MGTSRTTETAEFWEDDAAAIAERERIERTGYRMPAAVKEPGRQRPTERASAEKYKPFTDIEDAAASRKRWIVGSIVAAAVMATALVLTWYTWPVVTLKEFNSLTNGMTVEECTKVIGAKGATILESSVPDEFRNTGLPFVDMTEMRQWQNRDGSNTVVGFVDGKAFCKAQIGLK